MNNILASALVVLALMGTACGGGEPAATSAAEKPAAAKDASTTIEVANIAFKPDTVTVLRSTTVTWVNRDKGVRHTATSGEVGDGGVPGVSDAKPGKADGVFDGDLPDAGAQFEFTFEDAGTFTYFCEIHPSMVGTVVVE